MANNLKKNGGKTIALRNYQVELFQRAKERNSILFLPTGSGKTCIALWLIKDMSKDLKREQNRKWTFFLVNTVELVSQQSEYIRTMSALKVVGISSELGVDMWKKEQWDSLKKNYEVFVMTSQIYLNVLESAFLSMSEANLLIFDECHSAVKGHSMKKIMVRYDRVAELDRPRILGLSATLLNANIKETQLPKILYELEQTFRAEIITSKYSEEIAMYWFSTKPQESIENFAEYEVPEYIGENVAAYCNYAMLMADAMKLKDDEIVEQIRVQMTAENRDGWNPQDILLNAPGLGRLKLLKNALKDINVHLRLFGMYMAYDCCRCYLIQMYRFVHEVEDDEVYVALTMFIINVIRVIWKILQNELIKYGPLKEVSTILKTSTRKLESLFEKLGTLKETDKCIIFVERKVTARVLYRLINIFVSAEKKRSHLTVDFVMGSDSNPLRNTKEGLYDNRIRKKILERFKNKNLNILVATNVLEEGIDVRNCNLVIMFDEVKTFRSYVQSKGRARQETSKFIILNDVREETIAIRIESFKKLEISLKRVCGKGIKVILIQVVKDKDIHDDQLDDENISELYTTRLNANITPEESVSLVHRYCSTLPHDIFTNLTPYFWKSESSGGVICKLLLPVNSAWRDLIISNPCSSKKLAKQNVCLMAIKILHREKALDDHLNPIHAPTRSSTEDWIPNVKFECNERDNELYNIKISSFLKNSRPLKDKESYVHVIHMEYEYELPEIHRKLFCHTLLTNNSIFLGIVTRDRLPAICSFPVYSDLGKMKIRIECNAQKIKLSENELDNISKFHRFLFLNVLKVVQSCITYDLSSKDYFIVPLKGEPGNYKLIQKLIKKNHNTEITYLSSDDIRSTTYDDYIGTIIAPYYRNEQKPQYYIVTETKTGVNFYSQMENSKETFEEYYRKRYKLTPSRPNLPLFEVRKLQDAIECIVPRPVPTSLKQKRRLNRDIKTYLPPEFCCKFSFPAIFWYKSLLLPSILHRIHYLLLAEELRRKIMENSGVGILDIGDNCLKSDKYFKCETQKRSTPESLVNGIYSEMKKSAKVKMKQRRAKDVDEQNWPKDIHRCLDDLTIKDIYNFTDYVDQLCFEEPGSKDIKLTSINRAVIPYEIESIDFVDPPVLVTLKRYSKAIGPNQYQILQAITLKGAGDLFNMERAETLGDSFLKYATSLTIYLKEKNMNEGFLTKLKCVIVGNENLFICGKKLGIPEFIKAQKFIVDKCWYPPGFSVPDYLKSELPTSRAALLKIKIPYHEQFSGYISEQTVDDVTTTLKEYVEETTTAELISEKRGFFYCGKQKLTNKSIADVVEALIGVYLETCGIDGASSLIKYLDILNANHLEEAMKGRIQQPVPEVPFQEFSALCSSYIIIEDLFHYKFKNKGYILQALTHPSYKFNKYTDCYQKLEFLGDAILDFLITSYIYEYCDNLCPGELTDLRSSLVNNNTFGALSVRLGLHKHLLANSPRLNTAIKSFVDHQISMNYEIHGNELMKLINENDTVIAEEVEVPKSLGDLFESFAGAIFLDSGCNLYAVWRIYYNIMKQEIEQFSKQIPINPIRAVYELCPKCKFIPYDVNQNKTETNVQNVKIRLQVYSKNKESFVFVGKGVNTLAAKRAAAKLALKKLGYNNFVI